MKWGREGAWHAAKVRWPGYEPGSAAYVACALTTQLPVCNHYEYYKMIHKVVVNLHLFLQVASGVAWDVTWIDSLWVLPIISKWLSVHQPPVKHVFIVFIVQSVMTWNHYFLKVFSPLLVTLLWSEAYFQKYRFLELHPVMHWYLILLHLN